MARLKMLGNRVKTLDLRTAHEPAKVADRLYSSKPWLGLMQSIRKERGSKCESCGKAGVRLVGDHVVEIRDGGAALDRSNVQLLCWPCHTTKTNQARAARMKHPVRGIKSLQV